MVWFWQTRQRNSDVMRTMRASSAGSAASGAASRATTADAISSAHTATAARHASRRRPERRLPAIYASSFFRSGSIFVASTSGVSGPMCFIRITPLPSTTKVSGTP